jgi:putative pyruvate formate lyase activating enzyme
MRVYARGADTVSLVTPDHFVPHMSSVASILRGGGVCAPVVVNCSGYQSPEALALMEPWTDVYLADFKFGEKALAASLADCEDYVDVALEALTEMVRQKGFLRQDQRGVASRGVLVRHLVLPGHVENSVRALRMLAAEFGVGLPLSLMSQYVPARSPLPDGLDREVLPGEFAQVWQEAASLGFELTYIQSPGELRGRDRLPDFTKSSPFPASLSPL